ncbi:hypothetical protein BOTBODRAFT_37235 [Botryobasidium botryosum FD-172 SS1]|uniref:Ricin B lectin domain-containing protein n=1 Tax=Botryobasidium botryosum (strain FD-172 SS1) TaxID=930990 RepID=A0A067MBV0_BOTB1|nr:hypothetical protein BOTBODRAFT_37235 [Botryobasidium botryosum FD-172 SS1]
MSSPLKQGTYRITPVGSRLFAGVRADGYEHIVRLLTPRDDINWELIPAQSSGQYVLKLIPHTESDPVYATVPSPASLEHGLPDQVMALDQQQQWKIVPHDKGYVIRTPSDEPDARWWFVEDPSKMYEPAKALSGDQDTYPRSTLWNFQPI